MASSATITLLFCDLVGSTEIYARHGDTATDASRRTLFTTLRRVVGESDGIEVKNTGDGLMVAFPSSAAEAVRCAIALQQAMAPLRSPSGEPLQLRIGISTGEVTHDEDDWFGTPVNEAARLCGAAAPGTILASDVVRSLVEPRGDHRFQSSTPFVLKGLGHEVRASSVDWGDDESLKLRRVPQKPPRPARSARSKTGLMVAAVLVVVAAVAATMWVRQRGTDETPSVDAVSAPEGYTPELVDEPCPPAYIAADATAGCSALQVPENRAEPNGRQVRLQVVRLPARNGRTEARTTVAISQEEPVASYITDPLRADREMVVLARRGFGGTPALTCPAVGESLRAALTLPLRSPEYDDGIAQAGKQCGQNWTAQGIDLNSYAEPEAAADFRDLVLAMGGDAVDLRVDGEATSLALRIVGESSALVNAVLIGSPIEPGGSRFAGRIPDSARALDGLETMCREDPACSGRYGDIREQAMAWIAERNADPKFIAATSQRDGSTTMVRVDGDTLVVTELEALRFSGNVAAIPQVVAARSDAVVAAFHASTVELSMDPNTPFVALSAVWCIDQQIGRFDAGLGTDAAGDPALAALNVDGQTVTDGCKGGWATMRSWLPTPARSVPTLILAGGLDPTASPRRVELTARAFGEHVTVVVFPTLAGGVTKPPAIHPCITELESAFLDDPTAEVDGQSCVNQIPPPQWSGG